MTSIAFASPDLGLSIATSYRPSDDKQPSILVSRDTLAMSNSVSYTPGYLYHSHLHFIEDFYNDRKTLGLTGLSGGGSRLVHN